MTENSDSGTFGRYQRFPPSICARDESAYEFTLGCAIICPAQNLVGQSQAAVTITPTGAYFQTESTLTKAEIEIATNLSTESGTLPTATRTRKISRSPVVGAAQGSGVDRRVTNIFRRPAPTGRLSPHVGVDRPARGAARTLPAGAGAVGRQGHRRCDRPAGLVHRCVADTGRLRRPVSHGGSHPMAKQPSRRTADSNNQHTRQRKATMTKPG